MYSSNTYNVVVRYFLLKEVEIKFWNFLVYFFLWGVGESKLIEQGRIQ